MSLEHLDLICEALDCGLDELLVRLPNKTEVEEERHFKQKEDKRKKTQIHC